MMHQTNNYKNKIRRSSEETPASNALSKCKGADVHMLLCGVSVVNAIKEELHGSRAFKIDYHIWILMSSWLCIFPIISIKMSCSFEPVLMRKIGNPKLLNLFCELVCVHCAWLRKELLIVMLTNQNYLASWIQINLIMGVDRLVCWGHPAYGNWPHLQMGEK